MDQGRRSSNNIFFWDKFSFLCRETYKKYVTKIYEAKHITHGMVSETDSISWT